MAIERYGGLELSVSRALQIAPPEYASGYKWFLDHEGFIGPRPWRSHAPVDVDVKLCAQSGIQKPSKHPYAISISSSTKDIYSSDVIHHFEDGTWLFEYCAHKLNSGSTPTKVMYNQSLRRCLARGLPVGVFIERKNCIYECLGLAFVEQYDSISDTFLLHGPARIDDSDSLSPISLIERNRIERDLLANRNQYDFSPNEVADVAIDTFDEDERTRILARVVRRKRQAEFREQLLNAYEGRCAITQYDIAPALQAAHISSYLGPQSQLVTNGLLLRADLHILFDRMLISVNPDNMKIDISNQLKESCYADIENRPLLLPHDNRLRPSESRLAAHHAAFLRSERQCLIT